MSDDRLRVLEAEVQHLRAEVRRARRFRWAIGLSALAFGLVAAKLAPSVVRAERFELTDADGEVRGVLAADDNGPYLKLVDQQGGQALLEVRQGEATLFLDRPGAVVEPVVSVVAPPLELPEDYEPGYGPARIEFAGRRMAFQGVKLFCPKADYRVYIPANDDGSVDLPAVTENDWCAATLTGGEPGRVPIRPYEVQTCEPNVRGGLTCSGGPL